MDCISFGVAQSDANYVSSCEPHMWHAHVSIDCGMALADADD